MSQRFYQTLPTPLGELTIVATQNAIVEAKFSSEEPINSHRSLTPLIEKATQQLREYFARERTEFNLPVEPTGTEFQLQVWNELLKIPYGKVINYGAQAKQLGKPNASRAVGAANGKNPIAVIIPCHRVIGANGSLTGYAGGLNIKRELLALENQNGLFATTQTQGSFPSAFFE